jgi:hypothetical protein
MASYCGDDNPNCTSNSPCMDCINMSNVVKLDEDCLVSIEGGFEYLKEKQLTEPSNG